MVLQDGSGGRGAGPEAGRPPTIPAQPRPDELAMPGTTNPPTLERLGYPDARGSATAPEHLGQAAVGYEPGMTPPWLSPPSPAVAPPYPVPDQAPPTHTRRNILILGGVLAGVAALGAGARAVLTPETTQTGDPGDQAPAPPADPDAKERYPQKPRGELGTRATFDTSKVYTGDDVAYTFDFNGEQIGIPRLMDTANLPTDDDIQEATTRLAIVLCAMWTAGINPSAESQRKFRDMANIYAANPAAMVSYFKDPLTVSDETAAGITECLKQIYVRDSPNFEKMAVMLFDTTPPPDGTDPYSPLQVIVAPIASDSGPKDGLLQVSGKLRVRVILEDDPAGGWQPEDGVRPADALEIRKFQAVVGGGKIQVLHTEVWGGDPARRLTK